MVKKFNNYNEARDFANCLSDLGFYVDIDKNLLGEYIVRCYSNEDTALDDLGYTL